MSSYAENLKNMASSFTVCVEDSVVNASPKQLATPKVVETPATAVEVQQPDTVFSKAVGTPKKAPKVKNGEASFSLPRAVVNALIDQKASIHQICAILVLSCFTDKSGILSSAGISAVHRYTGANKTAGGTLDRSIRELMKIHVFRKNTSGRSKKRLIDLGPILNDAESYYKQLGIEPPVPAHPRAEVKFVIPRFDEEDTERVWFGSNLVFGFGNFKKPLQRLLESGSDEVARLLLMMYAYQDMPGWGGVLPYSDAHPQLKDGLVSSQYQHTSDDCFEIDAGAQVVVVSRANVWHVNPAAYPRVLNQCQDGPSLYYAENHKSFERALKELIELGLVYEVVTVLNKKYQGLGQIQKDASPIHELATLSPHKFTNRIEHGVGWATEITCHEMDYCTLNKSEEGGEQYAAIVRDTIDVMIIGIARLRFRVVNNNNATIEPEVAIRLERNARALDYINRIRIRLDLNELMISDCKVPTMG